jgi:hypothetical protein
VLAAAAAAFWSAELQVDFKHPATLDKKAWFAQRHVKSPTLHEPVFALATHVTAHTGRQWVHQ